MVQAYAAANVQACGTISGAHGAVDNRERRDLLDLEQQEEEEDVQQDEQQRDERQEEQRDEQQVEQQSRARGERRAAIKTAAVFMGKEGGFAAAFSRA